MANFAPMSTVEQIENKVKETVKLFDKEFEMYIPYPVIQERVRTLADKINRDMNGKCPLFIGVLNGAFLFCADLFKHITIECEISFVKISSYHGTTSSGKVKSLIGLNESVKDRVVIFIEDIVDTGDTAAFLTEEINKFHPESIHWASLLIKQNTMKHKINVDYKGFGVPEDFLVGYGLDYNGLGRNLNDLYKLKKQ